MLPCGVRKRISESKSPSHFARRSLTQGVWSGTVSKPCFLSSGSKRRASRVQRRHWSSNKTQPRSFFVSVISVFTEHTPQKKGNPTNRVLISVQWRSLLLNRAELDISAI